MHTFNSLADILLEYTDSSAIPYTILLKTHEWKQFRNSVQRREKNTCQHCNKRCNDGYKLMYVKDPKTKKRSILDVPIIEVFVEVEKEIYHFGEIVGIYTIEVLKRIKMEEPRIGHVHHTYYISGRLPWQYPQEDLQFLCHLCHAHIHQHEKIPVYSNNSKTECRYLTLCDKCNGSGYLPQYEHVQNGICFQCNGECFA